MPWRVHGQTGRLKAWIGRAPRLAALLIGMALLAVGCSQGKPRGSVAGTVQYRGAIVKEGIVSIYSPQLGFGNESSINEDGTFLVHGLRYGPYLIAIHPPLVRQDYGGKSVPSMEPKQVQDIPAKYRNPSTSGFACEVTGRRTSVELRME